MELQEAGRRALLVAIGLAASVLTAEVGTRIYAHAGSEMGRSLVRRDPLEIAIEEHGELGYRQRPNRNHEYANGTRAHWNAMGFRGPLVAQPKPLGSFRVILLGGSTTHGYAVDDDQTIDTHMRSILRQRYPEKRFEVVNLALDGYDSYQIFQRFKDDGIALRPDLVIVNTGVNDVRNARFAHLQVPDLRTVLWADNLEQMREQTRSGGPPLRFRIGHWFYLARLPGLIRDNFLRRHELASNATVEPNPDVVDYFETNIRHTAELVQQAGAGLILSTEPSSLATRYAATDTSPQSYWIVDAATTQQYRDRLAERLHKLATEETARGQRVAYLHLDLPPELFQDDCHLTPEGNRVVAEGFVDALSPFLKGASSERVAGSTQP
ncbi:MAG TPA: SGNH/GDSL hydrolase family protein [Myxococcota bacterium]|nr:SGNH/GDSL hydrolase family protein [Myxococcota bacterium]